MYFILSLLVVVGLSGEEFVLLIENNIYSLPAGQWGNKECILHWVFTSIIWGCVGLVCVQFAKRRDNFRLFERGETIKKWQWIVVLLLLVFSVAVSCFAWNGWKVLIEFYHNGWLKFIFQYIYYIFETWMIMLILTFSQKAFELWFHHENIPYGGVVLSLTWGAVHILTQEFMTGIYCMFFAMLYGIVYLLLNKDFKKSYIIIFLMFVL